MRIRAPPRASSGDDRILRHETAAILEGLRLLDVRSVVDIGGGHGALLAALLRAHPQMTARCSICRRCWRAPLRC
jgi:spermidine synthase